MKEENKRRKEDGILHRKNHLAAAIMHECRSHAIEHFQNMPDNGSDSDVQEGEERNPEYSTDRKSTRLNSSHTRSSRMPSSA